MHSMTGYGRGSAPVDGLQVVVELRSVNHRYLDLRTRFGPQLTEHGAGLEASLRAALTRGRVELSVTWEGAMPGGLELDVDRARAAFASLTRLRDELCPGQEVPLSLLSSVPDLYVKRERADQDAVANAVRTAAAQAVDQLAEMRAAEGRALAVDLRSRTARVRELAGALLPAVPNIVADYRERLRQRIETLLPEGMAVEPGRLEHEVALFADRADIAEELTRLLSHCDQFEGLTRKEGEAVGRRLDFLLQEMGREANTIGSKVSDAAVTDVVIDLKAELERMREQAQNVL